MTDMRAYRGFKSSFDRGCLSLWFNFRRNVSLYASCTALPLGTTDLTGLTPCSLLVLPQVKADRVVSPPPPPPLRRPGVVLLFRCVYHCATVLHTHWSASSLYPRVQSIKSNSLHDIFLCIFVISFRGPAGTRVCRAPRAEVAEIEIELRWSSCLLLSLVLV